MIAHALEWSGISVARKMEICLLMGSILLARSYSLYSVKSSSTLSSSPLLIASLKSPKIN